MKSLVARVAMHPPWITWVAIVVTTFAIYNVNFRELGLVDTIPNTLLSASIVREHNLDLDEFEPMLVSEKPDGVTSVWRQLEWGMAVQRINGHLWSTYPVGAAVLAAPIYVALVPFIGFDEFRDYRIAGKIAASLMVALSAGFVFSCLRRVCRFSAALLLTAFYAFGTTAWTIASQALWQHGPALACLSIALWLALRMQEEPRTRDVVLCSLLGALAIVCRPQVLFGTAAIAATVLIRSPRHWGALLVPAAVIGALQLVYNVSIFHHLSGGYAAIYQSEAHRWRHLDAVSAMTMPFFSGLAGILVSPGKGLFVYTPLAAIALIALPFGVLNKPRAIAVALAVWVLMTVVFYSKSRIWWGGTSYGPRYLTELMIPLIVTVGMMWERIAKHAWMIVAVVATGAVGIFVQLIGAATWECGWHATPTWVDFDLGRLWNLRDPEILRCARVLAEDGPKRPEFGPLASKAGVAHP